MNNAKVHIPTSLYKTWQSFFTFLHHPKPSSPEHSYHGLLSVSPFLPLHSQFPHHHLRIPSHFQASQACVAIAKDRATNFHVANIQKRTPPLKVPFLIDLNGRFMWVNCENQYLSSTYNAPLCHSTLCSKANSHYGHKCPTTARPRRHDNTCGLMAVNPVTHEAAMGELAQDALWLPSSTQGSSHGLLVRVPQFLFSCAPSHLPQRGFPRNAQGLAGLGHAPISLPIQLSSHFGVPTEVCSLPHFH